MIIIADSGSSKTDWVAIVQGQQHQLFQCKGLNPVTVTDAFVQDQLSSTFPEEGFRNTVRAIHFFGAGCFDEVMSGRIRSPLSTYFPNATIQVASDLLGAVIATCGNQEGITCILGTGSNSCWYNGQEIVDSIPSLGYQLGDEGSGAYLGKELIRTFFYRELPPDLQAAFIEQYDLRKQEVIDRVYRQKMANRYLASFTPFLKDHLSHPFVQKLLELSFSKFLVRHVFKYPIYRSVPIHFVGSIAYHFQDSLIACLDRHDFQIGHILEKPILGLERYYTAPKNQK